MSEHALLCSTKIDEPVVTRLYKFYFVFPIKLSDQASFGGIFMGVKLT